MRKFFTLAAVAALAAGAIPVLAAGACEDTQGRSQADAFGACESTSGNVSCNGATDTAAGGVGTYAPSASGAAICIDDESSVPLEGRYGVSNRDGRVSVYADMGDSNPARDQVAGTDWVRGDVTTTNPRVCVYRGGAGSAWLSGSGHDPSAENVGAPVLGPLGPNNPAPGVGDAGASQCFLGLGTPTAPPVPSPTVPPVPSPTAVPTGVPSGVPTGVPSVQ